MFNVRVDDETPAGVRFVIAEPPTETPGNRLSWNIGTLEPYAERRAFAWTCSLPAKANCEPMPP